LYAASGGVMKSLDAGATWQPAGTGSELTNISTLVIDPATPTTLYAGTYNGVYRSRDGGESWSAITSGLTTSDVDALAIDPRTPTTLYAGTWGGGVFVIHLEK
jgi:photosystem II stability/assembly factor-like uncharacterized protein